MAGPLRRSSAEAPDRSGWRFDLFVSFAKEDNSASLAGLRIRPVTELVKQLEKHRFPPQKKSNKATEFRSAEATRRRQFRACTYLGDFDLNETVQRAIREKIRASSALLVVCSTDASESSFVRTEINLFRAMHSQKRIIPAVLDTAPDKAFPDIFGPGAMWLDLRPKQGASVRQWRKQLAEESHKLVARVWDVPRHEVHNRFKAVERRRLWRNWLLRSAAVLLALFAAVLVTARVGDTNKRRRDLAAQVRLADLGFEVKPVAGEEGAVVVSFTPASGAAILYRPSDNLNHLADLMNLHTLDLDDVPISNHALEHLVEIQDLRRLWLLNTKVSDSGMKYIAQLRNLEALRLGPKVTDAGLEAIRELKQLRYLSISGTEITDASLTLFAGLPELATLYLDQTAVTSEAVRAFAELRPSVEVAVLSGRPPPLNAPRERNPPSRGANGSMVSLQTPDPHGGQLGSVLKSYGEAVVRLSEPGPGGFAHSGFFVSPRGHVITVTFATEEAAIVETWDGSRYEAEVVSENVNGFAVLKADVIANPYLGLDRETPLLGQGAAILGFGVDRQLAMATGTVTALWLEVAVDIDRHGDGHLLLEGEARNLAGFEGGPVVAADGRVLGMFEHGTQHGPKVAVLSQLALEALKIAGVETLSGEIERFRRQRLARLDSRRQDRLLGMAARHRSPSI